MPHNYSISSLEASQYLELPLHEFMGYVHEGKIDSKVIKDNRVFSRNELRRFYNENLQEKKDV